MSVQTELFHAQGGNIPSGNNSYIQPRLPTTGRRHRRNPSERSISANSIMLNAPVPLKSNTKKKYIVSPKTSANYEDLQIIEITRKNTIKNRSILLYHSDDEIDYSSDSSFSFCESATSSPRASKKVSFFDFPETDDIKTTRRISVCPQISAASILTQNTIFDTDLESTIITTKTKSTKLSPPTD
eukprot:Awhi_evm1s4055